MKEVDAQSLVIRSVRAAGGAAHKLSNRFLIGVCDLLVKMPGRPAVLIEVKLQKIGITTSDSYAFIPDLTKLQEEFLLHYSRAEMATGLLSFVERGGLGRRHLSVAWFGIDKNRSMGYCRGRPVNVSSHDKLELAEAGERALAALIGGI